MTDWQDAVNILVPNGKKEKTKKTKPSQVGLRCWECGLYIDNLRTGHYCTSCLVKHLRKYVQVPSNNKETESKDDAEAKDSKKSRSTKNDDSGTSE